MSFMWIVYVMAGVGLGCLVGMLVNWWLDL